MSDKDSELKELRGHRHEFILAYYGMAVNDLDRHLKIGWQSIVVAAGAAVSLSLGASGELPIPLAVTFALIVSFWGIRNVVDANYWAARAIGFLSNVEAVYFSEEDRKVFNPYIGFHPKIRLMDSLKNQFRAVTIIAVISMIFFAAELFKRIPDVDGFISAYTNENFFSTFIWELPVFVALAGIVDVIIGWDKRACEYKNFVESAPGPGVVKKRSDLRPVDLPDVGAQNLIPTDELHGETISGIVDFQKRLQCYRKISIPLAILISAAMILVCFM